MDGKQTGVAFIGLGLVVANLWTGPEKSAVPNIAAGNFSSSLPQLKNIGLELLGVVVLTVIAGISDASANVALVIVIGLALLWAITRYSSKSSTAKTPIGGVP